MDPDTGIVGGIIGDRHGSRLHGGLDRKYFILDVVALFAGGEDKNCQKDCEQVYHFHGYI
jgi:hypothetical protein